MEPVKAEEVRQVYSGKNHRCCCGCSGKHYFASQFAAEATKSHGYDISDQVNNKMVRRVVNIINKNLTIASHDGDYRNYVEVVIGTRLYIAYLEA